jgi:hypothetical protein
VFPGGLFDPDIFRNGSPWTELGLLLVDRLMACTLTNRTTICRFLVLKDAFSETLARSASEGVHYVPSKRFGLV